MSTRYLPNLIIFIASILTPFVTTIFFVLTTEPFILLPTFLIALIFLFVSTIGLRTTEPIKKKRKYYSLIAFGSVLLFIASYGLQLKTANYIYFKQRENKLNQFVLNIKNFQKIKEMSDGQRFWKSINNTSIEPKIKHVDTTDSGFGKKYFLDDILSKNGISKQQYEFFRQRLISTGFISFTILDDGTISFTMDGFLDNCFGFAYSQTGKNPKRNDCGDIISWIKVSDNWYAWGTT
jgi:hypothetical protein